jgi:hypothetical protein
VTKESGLGAGFLLSGYDFTGDVTAVGEIYGGSALTDQVTGIDKLAMERIGLERDGHLRGTTWFNPAANMGHKRLSSLPTADVQAQYWHRQVIGRPVACIVAKQANYDGTRGQDGSFTFEWGLEGSGYGLEWCTGLTAFKRTDTGATSGTGVDFTTSAFSGTSTFGAQAYIQVLSFTGVDATILIQASSDNGVGDAFAEPSGGFAYTVTGAGTATRIQTSRTTSIERYLRVATVTTSGFSSLVFAVAVARNDVTTAF